MKFPIPDGFEMPPDAEVGGQFQAVGTFQDNGDGTLTIIQIDGSDIAEMEVEDEGPKAKMEFEMEAEGPGAENLFAKAKKSGIPMKM